VGIATGEVEGRVLEGWASWEVWAEGFPGIRGKNGLAETGGLGLLRNDLEGKWGKTEYSGGLEGLRWIDE
jgi:hypothetical protein